MRQKRQLVIFVFVTPCLRELDLKTAWSVEIPKAVNASTQYFKKTSAGAPSSVHLRSPAECMAEFAVCAVGGRCGRGRGRHGPLAQAWPRPCSVLGAEILRTTPRAAVHVATRFKPRRAR
jgi:hypothetical protein